MKTNKPLEESGLFIKGINETIENEAKKQRDRFLTMLLGTFGVSSFHFWTKYFGIAYSRNNLP